MDAKQTTRPDPFPRLTEKDVAERLGVTVRTVQGWRQEGRGPRFYKLGRAVRYAEADVVAFLEAAARRSTSDPGPRDAA